MRGLALFLQSKALFSVDPGAGYLFKVRWSPSRPLVFSAVTADGRLLIYDLKVSARRIFAWIY